MPSVSEDPIVQAIEMLRRYTRHSPVCRVHPLAENSTRCTCGLTRAWNRMDNEVSRMLRGKADHRYKEKLKEEPIGI